MATEVEPAELGDPRPLRIYVASTDFDLRDMRAEVIHALSEWGYEPVHFEDGTFPVARDIHSHDVCLRAVEECDALVLVVGGRYGGLYSGTLRPDLADISITHAEARIACELGKPIVTFVRDSVWAERPVFKRNQAQGNSIELFHADDPRVYGLIDEIVHLDRSNWMDQFGDSVQLKARLRLRLGHIPAPRPTSAAPQSPWFRHPAVCLVLDALSEKHGVPLGFITSDMQTYTYPGTSPWNQYCRALRSSPAGLDACRETDMRAAQRAMESGATVAYQCHMGLTDFAVPIASGGRT